MKRIFTKFLLQIATWFFLTSLLLTLSLLIIFLGVDNSQSFRNVIGMRQIPFIYFSSKFVRDPELIFRGNPHWSINTTFGAKYIDHPIFTDKITPVSYVANFNSEGYRESTSPLHSQIAVVGDSFIEGGNSNSDTFAEHLKREIGQDVSNYGLSWYGPEQYLLTIKKYILPHKPKVILLSFYEGNDPEDTGWYSNWLKKGYYYKQGFTAQTPLLRAQHFYGDIYRFVRDNTVYALRVKVAKWRGRFRDPVAQRVIQVHLPSNAFPDLISQSADTASATSLLQTSDWIRIKELLAEFSALSKAHDFQPIVMHIPRKTHVYAPYISLSESGLYWKELQQKGPIEEARLNALKSICKDLQLNLHTITTDFQNAASQGQPTFYQTDLHWNSNGRQIAAKSIAPVMKRLTRTQ